MTDKLFDDLMALREAAQDLMGLLEDYNWWDRTRGLLANYPHERAYDTVNRAEFAEALNMLYGALYPDTDDDERQDEIYRSLIKPEED